MRKKGFLAAIFLASTLAFSALAFTACGEDTGPAQEADMTEGVYNCKMGSYDLLIKFYDAETYYFQTEMKGYRGKYEIKEEEITFSATKEDGSIYATETDGDKAKWVEGNKVIYFYKEDGTTPIDYTICAVEKTAHDAATVPAGIGYAYGTKTHTLAYNTETDQIMSFKGEYGSRTLSHTTGRNFTINDEKAIEQAKFMVSTLPDQAEAGKVESDYFLTLSQKGYETNIPALEAWELTNGKFEKNGNVYTLTDTISGATATLTVTETGATVQKGEQTVELVVWADVTPYAAEIKGSALGGKIEAKVRFNEDGTLIIYGSAKNYNGKYKASREGTITVSDVDADSPVTIISASFATEGEITTLTAQLSIATGNAQMPTATATATGTVAGKLYGLEATVLLDAQSEEAVFGTTKMLLEMKDDCTLVISVGGQSKVTAFFALNTATRQITFRKTSSGALAFTLASPAKITWTGRLSEQETEDKTYTFNFEAAKLGALANAKVAEKYSVTATVAKLGNAEVTLSFLADGTCTLANPKMTLAAGEWALSMSTGKPVMTFSNVSSGTLAGNFASQTEYKVTWSGAITTQQGSVEVTIDYTFPVADLANLL